MFYFKINSDIKRFLDKINFPLGCKYYCGLQLIALDEVELLQKELQKLCSVSEVEEFKKVIKTAEKVYFNSTHICQGGVDTSCDEDEDVFKDKIAKKRENPFVDFEKIEKEYELTQRQKEADEKLKTPQSEIHKIRSESSLSFAMSMIASFFLLVLGAYYFGKHFVGMNDSNTYILVLIVTIVVVLSESVLLMIKMNKDSQGKTANKTIRENSFAYKFNKRYRDQFSQKNLSNKKVHHKFE